MIYNETSNVLNCVFMRTELVVFNSSISVLTILMVVRLTDSAELQRNTKNEPNTWTGSFEW